MLSGKKDTPSFRLPALETPVGSLIHGANAICRHFARLRPDSFLYGENVYQMAEVDTWLDYACKELECPGMQWLAEGSGGKVKQGIVAALGVIDEHLKLRTYLVGERMTIADICTAVAVTFICKSLESTMVTSFPNLGRWLDTVCNRKPWRDVVSESSLKLKAPVQCTAANAAASSATDSNPPPSLLDMNEWKRQYSNTKDLRGVAMPWLWKNFDPMGYCFYYMKYQKIEGECTVSFQTANQLGGFLQRLDNSIRKDAFGVIDVVGKSGCFDIQGVWMFRGNDIPTQMKEHPSYEYHEWRKLDHKNAADKKLIEDYFCEDDCVENQPIADSKVYK